VNTPYLVERLTIARERIEQGWVQGMLCADDEGGNPYYTDKEPTGFCLMGSLMPDPVQGGPDMFVEQFVSSVLFKRHKTHFLASWNDNPKRRKQQVLSLLDEAIAEAQAEPSETSHMNGTPVSHPL
jgi:hypothetical protein